MLTAPTTQLDGVDAMLLVGAVMLALFAPLLPAWWVVAVAVGGMLLYLGHALQRHRRRPRPRA